MKKSKSAASSLGNRVKIDRAETYPGKDYDSVNTSKKPGTAEFSSRYNNPRASGPGPVSGNGVKKFFKHITDAAESYKNKDVAKNKKLSQQQTTIIDSPIVQLNPLDEMLGNEKTPKAEDIVTCSQKNESEGDDNNESEGSSSRRLNRSYTEQRLQLQQQQQHSDTEHPVGRVDVVQFEASPLVQPKEVTVSLTRVIDRPETAMNTVELVKLKNKTIETALIEKKSLLANILQIPIEDYDHISEVVDEIKKSSDVKELLLSSLAQADKLTRLINKQLDQSLFVNEGNSDDLDLDTDRTPTPSPKVLSRSKAVDRTHDLSFPSPPETGSPDAGRQESKTVVKEIPIVVSSSQLLAISGRLHDNLTQLLELISNQEKERERLKTELCHYNDQLRRVTSQQGQGVTVSETSKPSVLPSEETKPMVDKWGECIASVSVIDPSVTEHLDVIEPETFVVPTLKSEGGGAAAGSAAAAAATSKKSTGRDPSTKTSS